MMTAKANKVGEYHPWTTCLYAREEARRRGDRRVGTGHLVLGLLREPDVAQVLGCDLGAAREALNALDRDALVAVGIDRALDAPPVPTREPALRGGRPTLKAILTDHLPMPAGGQARDGGVRKGPAPGPGGGSLVAPRGACRAAAARGPRSRRRAA
jgi:Clp amino terminal domain, pathogenicity island component